MRVRRGGGGRIQRSRRIDGSRRLGEGVRWVMGEEEGGMIYRSRVFQDDQYNPTV